MKTENKLSFKEILVAGLAMFAIFFGAGNLILPPKMGQEAGPLWPIAFLGFAISEVILILCAIRAISRRQGSMLAFGSKVTPKFGTLIGTLVVLCIGPLIAVPRTAATTYEVAIKLFFPNVSIGFFSVCFFVVVLIFAINGSKVIDIIGKYMTPILLGILILIIGVGLSKPMPAPTYTVGKPFADGFTVGYMALDALAALFFTGMVLNNFRDKGITREEDLDSATNKAGLLAGIGLAIVYGGLTVLGAYSQSYAPLDISHADLLTAIVHKVLGNIGNVAMSIAVGFACLTTAVGLSSATANFFEEVTKGKLKYELGIVITIIASGLLAVLGVEKIVALSTPLLLVLYPVVIVLIVLNMFDKGKMSETVYRTAVIFTLPTGLMDCLNSMGVNGSAIIQAYAKLPLADYGFTWLIFAVIGIILGLVIASVNKGKKEKVKGEAEAEINYHQ